MIEFGKWYKEGGLSYFGKAWSCASGGTDILIRGELKKMDEFVYQLDRTYNETNPQFVENRRQGNSEILKRVLESGNGERGDVICFGDDRIRNVRRMDDSLVSIDNAREGPHIGDGNYLEIRLNEQYGGDYPTETRSSRADMIGKFLQALSSVA